MPRASSNTFLALSETQTHETDIALALSGSRVSMALLHAYGPFDAPTAVSAQGDRTTATVSWTAPSNYGAGDLTNHYVMKMYDQITDRFTRANSTTSLGTATSGQAWTTVSGTWGISNNQAYLVSGNASADNIAVISGSDGNGFVQFTLAGTPVDNQGIVFRYLDASNFWVIQRASFYATWAIWKVVSGVGYYVTNTGLTPTDAGTVVRVEYNEDNIWFYINGFLNRTLRDSANRGWNGVGIFQNSATVFTGRWDDFIAGDLDVLSTRDSTAIVTDTFTRSNTSSPHSLGTATSGQSWSNIVGTWGISGNQAYLATSGGTWNFATITGGVSDGFIQFTVDGTPADSMGMVFRYKDTSNFWVIARSAFYGTWGLYRIQNGVSTFIGNTALTPTGAGTTIRVEFEGSVIRVFADACLRLVVNDATYATATGVGLYADNTVGTTARWDNVLVGTLGRTTSASYTYTGLSTGTNYTFRSMAVTQLDESDPSSRKDLQSVLFPVAVFVAKN